VAGSASRSLVMRYTTPAVFLPFFVTVRRTCATWAAPANSVQGSFFSCFYRVGMLALTVSAVQDATTQG